MLKRSLLTLLLLVGLPTLAWAATASYLNFSTGEPGSYNAIYGSGFGATQGTYNWQVVMRNQGGTPFSAPITSWSDNQIIFRVPFGLVPTTADTTDKVTDSIYYVDVENASLQSQTTVNNAIPYSGPLPLELWQSSITGPDVKPHGDFSGLTDFCLECHMVHTGNGTATNQSPYGLLGYTITSADVTNVKPANVVEQVCMTCHQVGNNGGQKVGTFATNPSETPVNPSFGTEAAASDAHFVVYKNTSNVVHPMGVSTPPDSLNVTLGYLSLNTSSFESPGYDGAAPGVVGGVAGLYCGSCHSPHGDYSANSWMGWDAAQFSENYGYNAGGDATTAENLPVPTATNNLWAQFMNNGGQGTVPLTNALLIENPGHQNGIDTGAGENPNVPGDPALGGGTNPSPISMNFYPYLTVETSEHPGFYVNPTTDQETLGATDDTLSNFCMGCHNLNGGAAGYNYNYDNGNYDHGSHPLQAFLSPNSAGNPNHYDDTGVTAIDNGLFNGSTPIKGPYSDGTYGRILDGCTSCHGGTESLVPSSNVDGSGNPNFANGFSLSFASVTVNTDFPHSDANSNDFDKVLHYPPDGLCLSCHDHRPGQSSLP